ncbi:MAG: GDP/GTP exchange factor for ARF [Cirrosporium novae-zelandiae]|nr:MAG: GDP/GTP exchange factor for ARF [Cirrosporium novae-zelandiae]
MSHENAQCDSERDESISKPEPQTTMGSPRPARTSGSHNPNPQALDLLERQSTHISIAIDPVALITTECINVTSAMRKHTRWAHSSVSAILGGGPIVSFDRETSRPPSPKSGKKNDGSVANRWGLRGKKGASLNDNPLMSAFARLRRDLNGCKDIRTFDAPALLHPFLQVIRSSSTSAPITSLALVSISKFFAYNLLSIQSPRMSLGMQLLSASITHCRFEASDSAADEIVLLRILKLMEDMMTRPEGSLLGDESLCKLMETGLSMACQTRLSELLRRSAELSIISIVRVIFQRLKTIDVESTSEIRPLTSAAADASENIKMEPSVNGNSVASNGPTSLGVESSADPDKDRISGEETPLAPDQPENNRTSAGDDEAENINPYSLPSIRELFRVLVDLLDPNDHTKTDVMRVMSLRIIDVALEVAGPSIARHPTLVGLVQDDLCRYLFQLVRSENMILLNGSLRVAGTLLATCRNVLKLQQELFLSYLVACLHPRVEVPREPGINPALYEGIPEAPKLVRPPKSSQTSSGRSTPIPVKDRRQLGLEGGSRKPDAREAMVECIGALARIPSFMAELFINYDCNIDRNDLCSDMVGLLARNSMPDSATWSTTNVPPLCLDALLGYVNFLVERLNDETITEGYPDCEVLREQRARKQVIIQGATKFNESPKKGLAFLASQGIIDDLNDAKSVTAFLKGTTRISKKVLGEFISKKDNDHLLEAFIDHFDFNHKRVDEALRELLSSFRLPGESALIERIITVFSEQFCASSTPDQIADRDACFVLVYAIIMLNTDQHNPNIKGQARMTCENFSRNLRGVNGGADFDADYLQTIFNEIRDNEIILPDEHDNQHAFEYAWKELLRKTETAGNLILCNTNAFDADLFATTWKPVIATLSYVFMSASDDAVFSRVVTGFDQCAQIAAKYGLTEAFDHIIFCLSTISTLATDSPPSTALNTEVQASSKSVMVSELAVKFGRDYKAQLATVVLFRVLADNESIIRRGWDHISQILLNLFINSLIPQFPPELRTSMLIPEIPLQNPSQVIERKQGPNETGLLSAFTSYLSSYAADDPPEPSEEELEATLCSVDAITASHVDRILSNISKLPPESASALVSSLLSRLPESPAPLVMVVKPERPAMGLEKANGQRGNHDGPAYDPATIYILELATIITIRDQEIAEICGEALAGALQNVLRSSENVHPVLCSRAAHYLLLLLKTSYDFSILRPHVVLHSIATFDQVTLEVAALDVLNGIRQCIEATGALRSDIINNPDFWAILRRLHNYSEAARVVFDILQKITSDGSTVIADNYEPTIDLANDFATAGSIGAVVEQKRDGASRRKSGQPTKQRQENEVVTRGVGAITIVYNLTGRIPSLIEHSHLETNEAWAAYWSPIFQALTSQCVNPCREIRQNAFSSLQRSLLSPQLTSADHKEWTAIFGEVLFPLIIQLLKPEVYQSDPIGMSDTRVQAAALLCKTFVHYLVLLSEWEGMLDLWLKILDIMDRLMNSGQTDSLEEAIPENLKNTLLVMANEGYLVSPDQNPESETLWAETWKRLNRFLPDLFGELFPEHLKSPPMRVPSRTEVEKTVEATQAG